VTSAATALPLLEESASLVRRARAGDQIAMALLWKVGQRARKGHARAQQAFAAVQQYIRENPTKPKTFAKRSSLITAVSGIFGDNSEVASNPIPEKTVNPEFDKPVIPHGALDRIFDEDLFPGVVVRACRYQFGLSAAAVVLSTGPSLSLPIIQEIGMSQFGSDDNSACFFHGVKFTTDADWLEAAPRLDYVRRGCMVVGQCVGRARALQAARCPDSMLGRLSPGVGWELGE
jgi:hypothetical protein